MDTAPSIDYKTTLRKFFLFGLVLFTLVFVYIILRETKYGLIISPAGDAPLILFLKSVSFSFYLKLIFLGLFFLIYRRNNLPQILFVSIISLLIFFIFFHLWGFERADLFHPEPSYIQNLLQTHNGMESLIVAYGSWTYVCYYLLVDLWEIFTISFLFWALANQTFNLKEAKLCYPLLFIFPTLANILAGSFVMGEQANVAFEGTIRTNGFILLGGLILFICAAWLIKRARLTEIPSLTSTSPQTIKMNLTFKWTYLFLIFAIITALGFCHTLLSILFKENVKDLFQSPLAYSEFMARYSLYVGYSGIVVLVLTFWMIWKFGWLKSALIPPVYLFITTCFLLLYITFPSVRGVFENMFSGELPLILWLFAIQSSILGGLNPLFFATKEIAYIPLALTTKARGKAVVDVLLVGTGFWLGASLPAFFNLVPLNKNIEIILIIIIFTTLIWTLCVACLGKMFKKISLE